MPNNSHSIAEFIRILWVLQQTKQKKFNFIAQLNQILSVYAATCKEFFFYELVRNLIVNSNNNKNFSQTLR
jgi:hypothetical protein